MRERVRWLRCKRVEQDRVGRTEFSVAVGSVFFILKGSASAWLQDWERSPDQM